MPVVIRCLDPNDLTCFKEKGMNGGLRQKADMDTMEERLSCK